MNQKILKIGFYVITNIVLLFAISLLIEYRFLDTDQVRKVGLDYPESSTIYWLIVISISLSLISILISLRDWVVTKKLPFYIGMMILGTVLMTGILILFLRI